MDAFLIWITNIVVTIIFVSMIATAIGRLNRLIEVQLHISKQLSYVGTLLLNLQLQSMPLDPKAPPRPAPLPVPEFRSLS